MKINKNKSVMLDYRSERQTKMSDGKSSFYVVTFSMIADGVETALPGRMLMLANAEKEKSIPHTSLPEKNYKLTVQDMPSRSQFDGYAINVNKGVYIHQGNTYDNFAGCLGVCEDTELTTWNRDDGTSTKGLGGNTRGAVGKIIGMRNSFDSHLTGDKFIMQTNSTAPEMQKMDAKPMVEMTPSSTDERTPRKQ